VDGLTPLEISKAEERGRQHALLALQADPAARLRVITSFGLDYCRARYPEIDEWPEPTGKETALRRV
jgi:hypothetical protein